MNSLNQPDTADFEATIEQDFLVEAAKMLHRYGTPAYRLERVMKRVSHVLNVDADFLYTPTSLLVSFKQGLHRTRLERIEPEGVELGKLIDLDTTLDQLESGELTLIEAHQAIRSIDQSPSRHSLPVVLVASGFASACATAFLGGGIPEISFAAVIGFLIQSWGAFLASKFPQEHMLEFTAGFFSASTAIIAGMLIPGFQESTACLGSLIILVPGFSFTVALAELANRHLSCGIARMAGAGVIFLALTCGVALAWRLGAAWRIPPAGEPVWMPQWVYVGAVLMAPFSFAVLFQARHRDWFVIVVVAWCGFLTSYFAAQLQGSEFGAFTGALAVGVAANLFARIWDRPATVAQMPAILMLVPGSLGYRSLTAFVEQKGIEGLETAFAMTIIAISLVGGLLTSNLVVPPRRIL